MNILPKKRWHVRTKENIARVRKDEAEAAEKERQEQLRVENADREARLKVLKDKSKQKLLDAGVIEPVLTTGTKVESEHINLFADFDNAIKSSNKEHDKEIKEKQEDYEKKIGYLTYLGQDTNESLKKKNWYEVAPESSRFSRSNDIKDTYNKLVLKDEDGKPKQNEVDIRNGEVAWKSKQRLDPMNSFKHLCYEAKKSTAASEHKIKKHSDKHKPKSDILDKKEKLLQLREARLKREQEEKIKTELFLKRLSGEPDEVQTPKEPVRVKPVYNSQFNPELARQNYR